MRRASAFFANAHRQGRLTNKGPELAMLLAGQLTQGRGGHYYFLGCAGLPSRPPKSRARRSTPRHSIFYYLL